MFSLYEIARFTKLGFVCYSVNFLQDFYSKNNDFEKNCILWMKYTYNLFASLYNLFKNKIKKIIISSSLNIITYLSYLFIIS